MLRRAHLVCSEEEDLKEEISFLTTVFRDINGYPQRVINNCLNKVRRKFLEPEPEPEPEPEQAPSTSEITTNEVPEKKQPYIILPYMGEKGDKILKSLTRKIPDNVKPKVVYKGTKLATFFSAKDNIKKLHCSNLIYYYKGSGGDEKDDYTGETKVRLGKRIKQHIREDKESAIFKNFQDKNIDPPTQEDFSILGKNYTNRLKRRIAESLFLKENKSTLNIQQDAYQLKLFR